MNVNESEDAEPAFRNFGFEIEKTKDGSPTLRILNGTDFGEWMHHSGGAFSETLLIYGEALKWGFENFLTPQILSLGLGLGYVEVLAAGYSLLHNRSFSLQSFEVVDGLKDLFNEFYLNERRNSVYEEILQRTALALNLHRDDLFNRVQHSLQSGSLRLRGDFVRDSADVPEFDVLCYDAFSKKTSPELWDEKWMAEFFTKGSIRSCISSYASNGAFKRALAQAGYEASVLDGFQGKRNRTLALKNLPLDHSTDSR